ncbi:hypothetical protein SCUCBS95973_006358 [Sporothrix curviconia]|uniref:Ubiquilin n=1 Tax=Sporothrix curviconia TaxID=1260050 RepID=A0ABP0C5S1_9PEZI
MADAEGSSDPQITFKVKTSGDGLHNITMAESATVLDLKIKLSTEEYENIPVERQRLIYSGRVMKNDDTLGTYKIKAGNTLHLVKSAASNHPPAGSAAAASAGGGAARSSAAPPAIPTNMAAGTPANDLLAGLTGARYAGHANLPNMDIFGPDGGMNIATEDQIAEMLNNPAVAQSMSEALGNPAFIDHLIQQNPALRSIPNAREMIQSPMFRQMLTNPDTLRSMARMRSMLSSAAGAGFPAPGATDNTPANAPASPAAGAGAGAGGAAANPFGGFNPFLLGIPGANANANAAGGDAATNPMAALFPFGFPVAAPAAGATGTGANATAGTEGARSGAGAGAGAAGAEGAAAGGANAQTNPFASLFGGQATGAGLPGIGQVTPEMMQQAMQMFQGARGAGFNPFMAGMNPPAPADNRPPEEVYATQLRQLNDMGFYDFNQNVSALRRSGGSVEGALALLLGN